MKKAKRREFAASDGQSPVVTLCRGGLLLTGADGRTTQVPLLSGAVHYWRLDVAAWRPALEALRAMEHRVVETYVPWQVHEVEALPDAPPRFSFAGQRDVGAFLRLAHELGMHAIVRPGPHINAELTDFGLPERVLWNRDCQARTPKNNPVMLPAPPRAFPVPSYASKTFLAESSRWLAAVGAELRALIHPRGPVVLVQVDNEGALYFRDGVYDQDYHPDAIAHWRDLLRARYGTIAQLRRAYGLGRDDATASFDDLAPPTRYDVESAEGLPRHLDWAEAHETLLASAFTQMARALRDAGVRGVPTLHNLPMGESATPLVPSTLRAQSADEGVDLIALDYYHLAGDYRAIARRTSELAVSCDALDHPAFGAEMGAGAPPYFPPLDERDAQFTVLAAMAYGLRGWNIYMAVERDRWLGSPIDARGMSRPFALFWRKLALAHARVDFGTLVRDVPVRLIVPRSMRRLARVMHAFGPASQALFRVAGAGLMESVAEDAIDFGDGHLEPPPMRAGRALVAAERALDEEGIAYAFVDGGEAAHALSGASLIVVPTCCGLDDELLVALAKARKSGAKVIFTTGPLLRDGSFGARSAKGVAGVACDALLDGDVASDVASVRALLDTVAPKLPRHPARPAETRATLHRDPDGRPRVAFFLNPTKTRQRIDVRWDGVARVRDLLDGTSHALASGVAVEGTSVRVCEVLDDDEA
ncbi:MAG: beta-galactosidase [Polyangiales bacterium]